MYLLSETEQRVRSSVRDAILLLCRTGLKFDTELAVEGLLAVTVDKKHVLLLRMNETLQANECSDTADDAGCLCMDDSHEILDFSSTRVSDDTLLLNCNEEQNIQSDTRLPEVPNQCGSFIEQRHSQSVANSNHVSKQRHRKQQRSVRRFLDSVLASTSPSAVSELLSPSEQIAVCMSSESSDMQICSQSDGEPDTCACSTEQLCNRADEQANSSVVAASENLSEEMLSSDRECGEAGDSLRILVEEPQRCEMMTSLSLLSNRSDAVDLCCTSERSRHENEWRRDTGADDSPCRTALSLSPSLGSPSHPDHIPLWVDADENGEELNAEECSVGTCKTELSDNISAGRQTECQDFDLSANIKTEVEDRVSMDGDLIAQIASLGHNTQSLLDAQQQMAMVSQFGLSALMASMQSRIALLPKPLPWTIGTFPSLSTSSLSPTQGEVVGILASVSCSLVSSVSLVEIFHHIVQGGNI